MLELSYCRQRQKRLLACMADTGLDLVLLANPKHVYYFTGNLVDGALPQALVVLSSGHVTT